MTSREVPDDRRAWFVNNQNKVGGELDKVKIRVRFVESGCRYNFDFKRSFSMVRGNNSRL